jgi:hypothetical protein
MELEDRLQPIDGRLHRRWEIAISNGEHYRHTLDVIQVKHCDFLEFFKRTESELKAWSDLRVIKIAILHVAFGLKE